MQFKLLMTLGVLFFLGFTPPLEGPKHNFFNYNQISWLDISQFSQSEMREGIGSLLKKKFKKKVISPEHIIEVSIKMRLDPLWVTAIIWTESSFNPRAISKKGARGLMQLMPTTAIEILEEIPTSRVPHWLDPKGNILLGTYYLKKLLVRFKGNHKLATMAYNLGRSGLLRRIRTSGVPRMKYWDKVRSRYYLLRHEAEKAKSLARGNSIEIL
ncbi:MAG: soluble lytic murein transglycosylase-like protein [Bacteriovoracaceae bacterium]|jgi:soluble lytic murein transglycosylase-like protein